MFDTVVVVVAVAVDVLFLSSVVVIVMCSWLLVGVDKHTVLLISSVTDLKCMLSIMRANVAI